MSRSSGEDFSTTLTTALRRAAVAGAAIAECCDRLEHAEQPDMLKLRHAAQELRAVAIGLATAAHLDIFDLYADRLEEVELASPLGIVEGFEAAPQVRLAGTWHDLQVIQSQHDRLYRPDVYGLSRYEQLRHIAIHTSKLVGALARADVDWLEFRERRLPDLLLFGIKTSTAASESLGSVPLPRRLGRSSYDALRTARVAARGNE
jgi:hypothetical protein